MEIKKYYLTKSDNTRRMEKMKNIEYIVVTSSRYKGFSSLKNRNVIEKIKYKEGKEFSCHYIIDCTGNILSIIPDNEKAICTHNTDIDDRSISIMLSLNSDGTYSKEEIKSLEKLIHKLMKKYNILNSNVVREYDVNLSRRPIKFTDESILLYEIVNKK